ncbi:MAG: protein-L-isoaspartate(D-aspartate) O-methyltransferase [Beijerinckiaceae bacterium]
MKNPDATTSIESRGALLLKLRSQGLRNTDVLRAIETIPRELFVPHRLADLAARDLPLPIGCGQTMSEPSLVARMLEALAVSRDHRVLEIGGGSGYVTAILASLAKEVVSLERFHTLASGARARLAQLALANAEIICGDGLAEAVPPGSFDRILAHLAFVQTPAHLVARLAAGGVLICGRVDEGRTRLLRLARNSAGEIEEADRGACALPKPIAGVAEAL